MKGTSKRASKGNIQKIIMAAIKEAAADYAKYSFDSNIRKAPEYLLSVYIAREVCSEFKTVGFTLEMPVKNFCKKLGLEKQDIDRLEKPDNYISQGAKFDLVLTSRRSGNPRHVIEIKKTLSSRPILKDSKRLSALLSSAHNNPGLKSAFLVAISKRKDNGPVTPQEYFKKRKKEISDKIGTQFQVRSKSAQLESGKFGFSENECLFIALFEISSKSTA